MAMAGPCLARGHGLAGLALPEPAAAVARYHCRLRHQPSQA